MWFLATYGGRGSSVNCKFEIEDGETNASAVEAVPMRLDDGDNSLAGSRSDIEANDKILVEFRKVAVAFPKVDVGA